MTTFKAMSVTAIAAASLAAGLACGSSSLPPAPHITRTPPSEEQLLEAKPGVCGQFYTDL
jgi:hypothetical protein